MKQSSSSKTTISLVEILILMMFLSILAVITYIAVNPDKNIADSRNSQRSADIIIIINAVTEYRKEPEHNLADFGNIPFCTVSALKIGSGNGNIDLGMLVNNGNLEKIPFDPLTGSSEETGYTICLTSSGKIQIAAPGAENGRIISINL